MTEEPDAGNLLVRVCGGLEVEWRVAIPPFYPELSNRSVSDSIVNHPSPLRGRFCVAKPGVTASKRSEKLQPQSGAVKKIN